MDKKKAFVISLVFAVAVLGTSQAEAQVEIGKNFDREIIAVNPDNSITYKWTSQPERIIAGYANSVPIYQPYKITENQDQAIIETEYGSVILHKAYCSFSFYNRGFIDPGEESLFTDSIVAKRKTVNQTNWQNVNAVNNAACSPVVIQDENTITLSAEKNNPSAGNMAYQYIFDGIKWKTELEATNLSSLTDQVFGFTQTIDLNRDTVKFGNNQVNLQNHNGTTYNRTWVLNNQAKIIDLMNGINFDFDLGIDYLNSITVYAYSDGTSKLVFDYTFNNEILMPEQTFIVDPTYSEVADNRGRVYSNNNGADCSALTNTVADASTSVMKTNVVQECQIQWVEWTDIPTSGTVTSAYFEWDQTASSGIDENCVLYSYANQPSTLTTQQKWDQGWGGTKVNSTGVACSDGTNRRLNFDSTGISDLQAKINSGQGWFAGMVQFVTPAADAGRETFSMTTGESRLIFEYTTTPAPDAVDDLTVSSITQTTAFLDWTTPNLNGGNLTNYIVNVTTPQTSNPTTFYANTTDTEITLTGLTLGTGYSARVAPLTEGGYNASGNIVNFTTTTYNPPAAPSLSATADSDTAVRFTSVNGTTGDFNMFYYGLQCSLNSGPWSTVVSNSTTPNPRVYIYSGLTVSDTITCQWRDGSLAGFGAYSDNATSSPVLGIVQAQRSPDNDRLMQLAAWFDEMGGVYMGMSLFPFLVMMIGLLARPKTTHIFTIITLCFMGIIHASGFYQYPDWFWTISLLFGLVLVLARRWGN